uniref:replication protein RepA n=1 Tax=Polaromonas sp. TaxID=1869339 RepID=UPI0015991BDD|nr:replication protein RepA [Polaromonas sp.]QJS06512.1 replication protein, RepA replicase [Polaromonas sp.]
MATNLTPQTIDSLINQALAIEDEHAQEAGALGFMARAMVQATLPHRRVEGNEFERKNGSFTLTLQAPSKIGLPYGSIPRLLLAWVTTEAVKTKSRELELGGSMSSFMAELGLSPTGGANGSITRLKNQTRRLFSATITASYEDGEQVADMGYRLADKSVLWWHSKDPEQAGLWKSTVTLSEHFFHEVIDRPVPIDMRAIRALKQSPMALDIYTWLTYRASYLKQPTVIPWSSLALQFGSNYAQLRQFKAAFLDELKKVVLVYGCVQVEAIERGLIVKPSLTHIGKKSRA